MRKIKYISVLLTALILASCSNSSNDKSSTDTSSAESSSLQSSAAESTAESTAAEWQTVSDCAFDGTTFTCNLGTFEAQSTEYTEPAGLEELTPYIINNLFDISVQADVAVSGGKLLKCSAMSSSGEEVNDSGFYPVSCYKNILTVTKDDETYKVDMSAVSEYEMNDFCADTSTGLWITAFKFTDTNKMVAKTVGMLTEVTQNYDESTGRYIGESNNYEAGQTDYPYFACEIVGTDGENIIVKTNLSDDEITLTPSYYIGGEEFSDFRTGDRIAAKFTDTDTPELAEYSWSVIKPCDDIEADFSLMRNLNGLEVRALDETTALRIYTDSITDKDGNEIDADSDTADYSKLSVSFEDIYTVKPCSDSDGDYTEYHVKKCVIE